MSHTRTQIKKDLIESVLSNPNFNVYHLEHLDELPKQNIDILTDAIDNLVDYITR